jgi:hypothetical protein
MSKEQKLSSSFTVLLNELDLLKKAMPNPEDYEDNDDDSDEEKAKAAAAAAAAAAAGDEKINAAAGSGKEIAKSMVVTLADGSQAEVLDGAEMIKALQLQVEGIQGDTGKVIGVAVELIKAQGDTLAKQGALIKSMQAQLKTLGTAPAGRKSVLNLLDKPDGTLLVKSQQDGMNGQEFMAKANATYNKGGISGVELTTIDVCLRQGVPIDDGLIAKVLA